MKWVVDKYKKDLSPTFTKYGTLPKNMVLLWDFVMMHYEPLYSYIIHKEIHSSLMHAFSFSGK